MRYLLIILFLLVRVIVNAQKPQIVFYDAKWIECIKSDAKYFRVIACVKENNVYNLDEFYANGKRYQSGHLSSLIPELKTGIFTKYDSIGNITELQQYENDTSVMVKLFYPNSTQVHGVISIDRKQSTDNVIAYYPNGNVKCTLDFKNDKLIKKSAYTLSGKDTIYKEAILTGAKFPKGEKKMMRYLKENIKYPVNAKEHNIEGEVLINFTIDINGDVTRVKVIRSIPFGEELEQEALRAMKEMPRWIPATFDNVKRELTYKLPIKFSLRY